MVRSPKSRVVLAIATVADYALLTSDDPLDCITKAEGEAKGLYYLRIPVRG